MSRKIILLLVLLTLLAACNARQGASSTPAPGTTPVTGTTTEATPATSPSGEVATVTFFTSGDPAEKAAYETLVTRFNESHPNIKVEMSHVPSAGDYRTRLATDFAAGSPPDVTLMNFRRIAAFLAKDQLEPIGPYLDKSTLVKNEDFFPVALDAFRWNGTVTCLPQNISSLVVYYNRDLFDAAGVAYPENDWTWDQFVETAKALTKDTDGDGNMDQYGLGTDPVFFRVIPFVWQAGGEIVDNPITPMHLTMTEPAALQALQWFVDLRQAHGVIPTREEEGAMDSESRFMAGTTAMFMNSRRGTPTYREIEDFTWDVAPLPTGAQPAGILHSDGYCLSKATTNKEAAWAFIEYANSTEGQAIVARTGRTVPSRMDTAQSEAFLTPGEMPEHSQVWLDVAPILRPVPVISTWDEIEGTVDEEVERAVYGDITVQEAAQLAVQRTDEYFLAASEYYPK